MTVQLKSIGTDETKQLSQGWNSSLVHLGELIRDMRREVQALASASTNLSGVSETMHSASEQVLNKTDSIGTTITGVSHSLTTLASAIAEMESSIREIARSAQSGVGVAQKATDKTAEADLIIKRLQTSTNKVQDVVGIIEAISGQVQMLSLNAAIEAHRAGEAGRGFAVVAQEVKTLANQTRTAAAGIRDQAKTIALDANQTSLVMEQMRDDIRQLHEMQSVIATAVEEQSATTSEIGRNVQDVAGSSKTIEASLEELRQSAHSATHQANTTHEAAGGLGNLANDLGKAVSGFKI
jgi:methyl-accepting chemotaxis protein